MISFSKYFGKRVTLLIKANAYDAVNYSSNAKNSLVLLATIAESDEDSVIIKDIKVISNGLFANEHTANGIKIKGGEIDKKFIIAVFDDFDE